MGVAAAKTKKVAGAARTLAIDIGGTGIKTMVLSATGEPLTERLRVVTPKPATTKAVIKEIVGLAAKSEFDRASVGFPGVVRKGITETAHNLDPSWEGFNLAQALTREFGRPVRAANDADIQGFGAIEGKGVELVITLGTGLGAALFLDGRLVPNLELAHHPFRKGKTYEEHLGEAARKKDSAKHWNKTLRKAITELEKLFNYDKLYIGGGNASKIEGELPANVKVVANTAGLLGGIALWRD